MRQGTRFGQPHPNPADPITATLYMAPDDYLVSFSTSTVLITASWVN